MPFCLIRGMCRIGGGVQTGNRNSCVMVLFTLENSGVKHLNTQPHTLFSKRTHSVTLSAKCFSSNRSVILLLVYFRLRGETEEVKHSSDILMPKTLQALYRCFPVRLFSLFVSLSLSLAPCLSLLLVLCGHVLHKSISSTDITPPW